MNHEEWGVATMGSATVIQSAIAPAGVDIPKGMPGGERSRAIRKRRTHKRIIPLVTGAALASVAAVAWLLLHGQTGTQYWTAPVEVGPIDSVVSSTGSPNPVVTVQVGSEVSGNIFALYADFNTRVKKGQLVARIEPQIFEARVNQVKATLDAAKAAAVSAQAGVAKAKAELSSAQAALVDAKANVAKARVAENDGKAKYDRRALLAGQGVISPDDLDTAKATYDSAVASLDSANAQQRADEENVNAAKASLDVAATQLASSQALVKQDEASLAQAQLDLDHTYIKAPVDGVVVSRNVDVGQTVAASLQAPTLFLVAQDLTKMQVDTNVSEADVGRVRLNQPATFTVDAYPGETFHGQVWQIRQAAINLQNVVTYDVVISVSNKDLKLFPGMTANVKILVDRRDNVLKVPNSALRFQPPAAEASQSGQQRPAAGGGHGIPNPPGTPNAPTVWILDSGGKLKAKPVQVGISDAAYTEITGGDLKEGDQVVIAALTKKSDSGGAPVSPGSPGGRAPRF